MLSYYRKFIGGINRTQLETFKVCHSVIPTPNPAILRILTSQFGFYLLSPILVMYYVGIDTDKKFNLPGFWPDPATLNQIPKEPHEIQAEVARIRRARAEKRARLEEKAKQLGITEDSE